MNIREPSFKKVLFISLSLRDVPGPSQDSGARLSKWLEPPLSKSLRLCERTSGSLGLVTKSSRNRRLNSHRLVLDAQGGPLADVVDSPGQGGIVWRTRSQEFLGESDRLCLGHRMDAKDAKAQVFEATSIRHLGSSFPGFLALPWFQPFPGNRAAHFSGLNLPASHTVLRLASGC